MRFVQYLTVAILVFIIASFLLGFIRGDWSK